MQLATLLLKYLQGELVHHRKELIKFGWNHLKREDSPSKQWAFVNVCHFLDAYQAPEKIILQVSVQVLLQFFFIVSMERCKRNLKVTSYISVYNLIHNKPESKHVPNNSPPSNPVI